MNSLRDFYRIIYDFVNSVFINFLYNIMEIIDSFWSVLNIIDDIME